VEAIPDVFFWLKGDVDIWISMGKEVTVVVDLDLARCWSSLRCLEESAVGEDVGCGEYILIEGAKGFNSSIPADKG